MRIRTGARTKLDAELLRLREEQLVEVELAELVDLVREPDVDPMQMSIGPTRPGVEDLAATLLAARRLPAELTVRVVLPDAANAMPSIAETEAAFHRRAEQLASVAWRDGMAQRAMGLSQLPLGLAIATVSWVAAYAFGFLATQVEGAGVGMFAVSAMIAITIAWVVSWMVVEATMLDWRFGARQSAVYDLLSRAHLEVASRRREGAGD
jgi:uncharacterized membrane protein (DUF485 family)